MSVKEVNPLHSRYIELTARFKACWTFQKFHDGLQKFFGRQDLETQTYDFQSLYKRLRDASRSIGGGGGQSGVGGDLDAVAESLQGVIEGLDRHDRLVSPSLLRLFFQRAKVDDERILIEMVRFYQEAQRDRSWDADRIDKVDFLISRLAETIAGPGLTSDRPRLEKVLERLSENVSLAGADPTKVNNRRKVIESVRSEMREVSSLEQLEQVRLVGHYRDLKHSLGRLYFEAGLLPKIIDTNAALSSLVESLWRREEEEIFAEYRRISKLEPGGAGGGALLDAVNQLHTRVGSFRKQMSTGNMRLAELAGVREALTSVDSLIAEQADRVAEPEPMPGDAGAAAALLARELPGLYTAKAREIFGPPLREILTALAASDDAADVLEVASSPDLVHYRLVPREITAFRRLVSGGPCDDRLESFVLAGSAIRNRLNWEVSEIHGTLSSAPGSVGAVLDKAQELLRMADWQLKQFAHFFEALVLADLADEAHGIQRCRMQLMRDYSGLWLEIDRLRVDAQGG